MFCCEHFHSEPGYLKPKNKKDFVSILMYHLINGGNFRSINLKPNGGYLKLKYWFFRAKFTRKNQDFNFKHPPFGFKLIFRKFPPLIRGYINILTKSYFFLILDNLVPNGSAHHKTKFLKILLGCRCFFVINVDIFLRKNDQMSFKCCSFKCNKFCKIICFHFFNKNSQTFALLRPPD